jgi:hypothetical protein
MYKVDGFWFMVFNTTCKHVSVLSLWSVLLVEGNWFFHYRPFRWIWHLIIYVFCIYKLFLYLVLGPSWLWSYGSWIYNHLCNQCLIISTAIYILWSHVISLLNNLILLFKESFLCVINEANRIELNRNNNQRFSAHLVKGNVSFCRHLSSINFSHSCLLTDRDERSNLYRGPSI